MDKLKDFLRISEAAEYLGVSSRDLLEGEPVGVLVIPTSKNALARMSKLEERLRAVEEELGEMKKKPDPS